MTRIRIATLVAVLATGLFLMGCGAQESATWHDAPVAAEPAGLAGGTAGGEPISTPPSGSPSPSTSSSPSSNVSTPPDGILKNTGSQTEVSLTFDDGPDPSYTPKILELLRNNGAKATFCLVGVQVQQFPDLVRQIVAEGHTLCNHTWKHDLKLGTRGEQAIRADLQRTNDAILAAVPGAQIKYFRHPGGMWTPTAIKVAQAMGMTCAGWEVDTDDWNVAKYPAGEHMKQHVLSTLRNSVKPGSIVLAHDAGGDRRGTMAAYEIALPELKSKYQLVGLP
ncbi:hydrolase [Virgisporangium aliadipatigenens]|uniref:Hydrolase n=1 Tax=Virgisporangium aliadipatigenens TaxID=741659 RepID=A0A8J3YQL1_9ACTN|nr:polysaccharide deacetylase family protein [Virgisporangium aliadipatigenens]GIJ49999.1 hydrolase [Virgisporangium aliadipatigenens]